MKSLADPGTPCRVVFERDGTRGRLIPYGNFDLANVPAIEQEIDNLASDLEGCTRVDLDLGKLDRIDGAGAVLLARLADRIDAGAERLRLIEGENPQAARLIVLYRQRRGATPTEQGRLSPLARLGAAVAAAPAEIGGLVSFTGRFMATIPKAAVSPRSVHWRSLSDLLQSNGADAMPVTSAANLLVGLIIGFLGVSQLGRFGALRFVPELLVVSHFRELGPLVTAIVVAGRSGAGLASELGTMKVSEEIDALRTMGFDPVRWLVLPRCLALVVAVPLLTWIGYIMAVLGCMAATVAFTEMTPTIFLQGTAESLTLAHFASGIVKTPFLALAIALIACQQGLATRGGAAAVGARTTMAVVAAMLAVIVISTIFTILYTVMGI